MKKIGLLSDTHHYVDEKMLSYFDSCDEIWHAGDFGTMLVAEGLRARRPLRGVYGNIDGYDIRSEFPETLLFSCEQVKVMIRHVGGYPGKYAPGIREQLAREKPLLFISGHSHLLKIIYDPVFQCLHINPGAAGLQGWHKTRTLVRFVIEGTVIRNCEVIELGKRGDSA